MAMRFSTHALRARHGYALLFFALATCAWGWEPGDPCPLAPAQHVAMVGRNPVITREQQIALQDSLEMLETRGYGTIGIVIHTMPNERFGYSPSQQMREVCAQERLRTPRSLMVVIHGESGQPLVNIGPGWSKYLRSDFLLSWPHDGHSWEGLLRILQAIEEEIISVDPPPPMILEAVEATVAPARKAKEASPAESLEIAEPAETPLQPVLARAQRFLGNWWQWMLILYVVQAVLRFLMKKPRS